MDAPPWQGPPVWVHGDLHPGNLLVQDGRLTAVIDFVDLTAGDPATDLASAWLTFDRPGRARFRARVTSLCRTDDATWVRAGGWALVLATAMLTHSEDDAGIARIGAHAIREIVDEGA